MGSEFFYALGFVLSDGCLSRNTWYENRNPNRGTVYRLSIGIQLRDKEILEKIALIVNPLVKLHEYKGSLKKDGTPRESIRFCTEDQKIIKKFIMWGLEERKSTRERFPKNIPDEYFSHFIRGYFDGDGCVSRNVVKIFGCKNFLIKVLQRFTGNVRYFHLRKRNGRVNQYILESGDNLVVREFRDFIYRDCGDLYLKRKKDRLDRIEYYSNSGYRGVYSLGGGRYSVKVGKDYLGVVRDPLEGALLYNQYIKDNNLIHKLNLIPKDEF